MKLRIAISIAFAVLFSSAYAQNSEKLLQDGLFAFKNDNFTQAISCLSKYTETEKENAIAYNTLGRAYSYMGNFD